MGVRPPLLILVIVRAVAPVTGRPPRKGTTILAIPKAISSVLGECLSLIIPSTIRAVSKLSIAASKAIEKAGSIKWDIIRKLG